MVIYILYSLTIYIYIYTIYKAWVMGNFKTIILRVLQLIKHLVQLQIGVIMSLLT